MHWTGGRHPPPLQGAHCAFQGLPLCGPSVQSHKCEPSGCVGGGGGEGLGRAHCTVQWGHGGAPCGDTAVGLLGLRVGGGGMRKVCVRPQAYPPGGGGAGMHWNGGRGHRSPPPLQGAQPMPSYCLPAPSASFNGICNRQ